LSAHRSGDVHAARETSGKEERPPNAEAEGHGVTRLLQTGTLRILIATKENIMKSSTKDAVAGKTPEVKGTVKEKVGKLINNPNLEAESKVEKVAGTVQKKIAQVKKVLEK
jgi:uncharacterized protein YjbJ (UPF0337 family)